MSTKKLFPRPIYQLLTISQAEGVDLPKQKRVPLPMHKP